MVENECWECAEDYYEFENECMLCIGPGSVFVDGECQCVDPFNNAAVAKVTKSSITFIYC